MLGAVPKLALGYSQCSRDLKDVDLRLCFLLPLVHQLFVCVVLPSAPPVGDGHSCFSEHVEIRRVWDRRLGERRHCLASVFDKAKRVVALRNVKFV